MRAATCSNWQVLDTEVLSPSAYPLPFFRPSRNLTVEGSVDVYSYLSNNCTGAVNSGMFPLLRISTMIRKHGKTYKRPYTGNRTVFGYGFSGEPPPHGMKCKKGCTMSLVHTGRHPYLACGAGLMADSGPAQHAWAGRQACELVLRS